MGAEGATVRLEAVPTGRLAGRLAMPDGEEAPGSLTARFASATTAPPGRRIPEASVECPVADLHFACEVPSGPLDVRLRARGFVSHYLWNVSVPPGGDHSVGALRLRAGASVAGWIETPDGRIDTESASVTLAPLNAPAQRPPSDEDAKERRRMALSERPDARGFFHFEGVAPGQYVLEARHPGYAAARRAPIPVEERAETVLAEPARLRPPETLEVVVAPPLDPKGRAWTLRLSRVDEYSRLSEPVDEVELPPDGWHRWEGLAPGPYVLAVRTVEGETPWKDSVRIEDGSNLIQVEIESVPIRGRVALGEEGLAADLRFVDFRKGALVELATDETGSFEGTLPREGSWDVRVKAREVDVQRHFGAVEVETSDTTGWADVDLEIPDTRVRGRVVDEAGAGELATVVVVTPGRHPMVYRTDEEGEFVVRGLEPGPVQLFAEAAYDPRRSELELLTLVEDLEPPALRLVVRERLLLTGEVISPAGPVVGARVELTAAHQPTGIPETAVTDVRGVFEVELPAGTRGVRGVVEPPGHALSTFVSAIDPESPLSIAVGTASGELTLELTGGVGPLFGAPTAVVVLHDGRRIGLETLSRWSSFHGRSSDHPRRMAIPAMAPGRYLACRIGWERLAEVLVSEPAGDPACAAGYLAPGGAIRLELPGGEPGSFGSVVE